MNQQILDIAIVFSAKYLPYPVFLGMLGWFILHLKRRVFWELVGAAVLSRLLITELIRLFWHRARPFVELGFQPLVAHSADASFPSGHATFFFALSGIIFAHDKKAGTLFFMLSGVIGVARVFAGIHWASDIIGGAFIGIGSALVMLYFFRKKSLI